MEPSFGENPNEDSGEVFPKSSEKAQKAIKERKGGEKRGSNWKQMMGESHRYKNQDEGFRTSWGWAADLKGGKGKETG